MTASKTDLNPKVYRVLLGRTLPTVIHSEEQNERYLEILTGFDSREELSPGRAGTCRPSHGSDREEAEHYALKASTPVSMLRFLMDQHGLRQKDLLDVSARRAPSLRYWAGNASFQGRI